MKAIRREVCKFNRGWKVSNEQKLDRTRSLRVKKFAGQRLEVEAITISNSLLKPMHKRRVSVVVLLLTQQAISKRFRSDFEEILKRFRRDFKANSKKFRSRSPRLMNSEMKDSPAFKL